MEHKLKTVRRTVTPILLPKDFRTNPIAWLEQIAQTHSLRWLLAHADDGIIWGEVCQDGLHLANNAFSRISPPLRFVTLQQLRLFAEDRELLLWRTDDRFSGRLLHDVEGTESEYFEERHLLWGTHVEEMKDGFSKLREGAQGLRHAPPISIDVTTDGKLRGRVVLTIRHYLSYDEDGQAYVNLSRLAKIHQLGGGQNEP